MPQIDWSDFDDIHEINAEIERAYARRTELLEQEALAMQARAGELSKATGVPVEEILKLPKKRGPKPSAPRGSGVTKKGKAASCNHADRQSAVNADNSPRVDSGGNDIAGILPA